MTFKSIISTRSNIKYQEYSNLWTELSTRIEGAIGEKRNVIMESLKILKSINQVMDGINGGGNYIKASKLIKMNKPVRFNKEKNMVLEIEKEGKGKKLKQPAPYPERKKRKIEALKIVVKEIIDLNFTIGPERCAALKRLQELEQLGTYIGLISFYGELTKEEQEEEQEE